MNGPYRTPADVEPDPLVPPLRASAFAWWIRAISGAAVVFLLTASAAMISLMRDIAHGQRLSDEYARERRKVAQKPAPPRPASPPPAPPPPVSAPAPAPYLYGCVVPAAAVEPPPSPVALTSPSSPAHAPAELWRRAQVLAAAGADLTLSRTTLSIPLLDDGGNVGSYARIEHSAGEGGVRLEGLPERSAAALAGLQRGDLITAVNGYSLRSPEAALEGYASIRATRTAVLEIRRAGRRIVLEVDSRSPIR